MLRLSGPVPGLVCAMQIEISDELHDELKKFCDQKNVPLKEYIWGVLETSMYFPDGIEVSASYAPKEKKKTELEAYRRGMRGAVELIVRSDDSVFRWMSKLLGKIQINFQFEAADDDRCEIEVNPGVLQMYFASALREAKLGSVRLYLKDKNQ